MLPIIVSEREFHTILAALRHYQDHIIFEPPEEVPNLDLATNDGKVLPLGIDDINDLCERINTPDGRATVTVDETEVGRRWTFNFNRPEAKGTITLEESGYGLYVFCDDLSTERPIGLLDLYYQSPAGKDPDAPGLSPKIQYVFYDVNQDDPMGRIRHFEQRAEVDFEAGVAPTEGYIPNLSKMVFAVKNE